MDYQHWSRREQRIRLKILRASPEIQKTGIYRTCAVCGELCLCHEETCPNCDGEQIGQERLSGMEADLKERIRCKSRFANLA